MKFIGNAVASMFRFVANGSSSMSTLWVWEEPKCPKCLTK